MTYDIHNDLVYKRCLNKRFRLKSRTKSSVNVEISAQYIFLRILHMVLDARKYDVSENINHYRLNKIQY